MIKHTVNLSLQKHLPILAKNYFGHVVIVAVSLILTIMSLSWMGFDFNYIARSFIGEGGDTLLNSWTIYQAIYNLTHYPIRLGYSTIFYGDDLSFAYTIAPYGIAIVSLPIYALSGGNLFFTYNIYYLSTFVLTAWSTYLLINYLLKPPLAATLIASLMVAFAQFRFLHFGHIETLSTQFYVFSVYLLHRLIDEPKMKWSLLLAISFWLTMITSGYLGIIFIITGIPILAFCLKRRTVSENIHVTAHLFYTFIVVFFICAPFLLFRLGNSSFRAGQSYEQSIAYSSSLAGWFSGTSQIYRDVTPFKGEGAAFIGFTPIVLAALAFYYRRTSRVRSELVGLYNENAKTVIVMYAVITIIGFFLTLGPVVKINDAPIVPSPYLLLMQFPVFSWIRVPGRFILMGVIGTAVLSAYTMAIIARRYSQLAYYSSIALIGCLLVLELTPFNGDASKRIFGLPATQSANRVFKVITYDRKNTVYDWLAQQPRDTAVLHYPVTGMAAYQYFAYQPYTNQPMLNGGGSYLPNWYIENDWNQFPNVPMMNVLYDHHIRYILIHHDLMTPAENETFTNRWNTFQATSGKLPLVATFGSVEVYSVTPNAISKGRT